MREFSLDIHSLFRPVFVALMLLALPLADVAQAAVPTAEEMLFLYEVNRARSDPPAWALEYGLDQIDGGDGQKTTLQGVAVQPPLALNTLLVDSSRFKAQEMAANNYFDHQSAVTGIWPNKLERDFSYPLATSIPASGGGNWIFPDTSNGVESIAAGYGPGANDFSQAINALIALIVDSGIPSLGHRVHILGIGEPNSLFVEAAAGYGVNGSSTLHNYWAFHTGVKSAAETFLTGVVYSDANSNQLYDNGEGLSGVTVAAGAFNTTTNSAGGYSLAVTNGSYTASCNGGSFFGDGECVGYRFRSQPRVRLHLGQLRCLSRFRGRTRAFRNPRAVHGPVGSRRAFSGCAGDKPPVASC